MFEHLTNCHGEISTIVYSLPLIGAGLAWLRSKFHHRKHHGDCTSEKPAQKLVLIREHKDGCERDVGLGVWDCVPDCPRQGS
jgi:hypothetical protein